MEKGLNHNTMYVRLFLLSFHNFHFIFSCGLQLNSCKVFFFVAGFGIFHFFQESSYCWQNSSVCQKIFKKKKKNQTNKQTRTEKCFPIHS